MIMGNPDGEIAHAGKTKKLTYPEDSFVEKIASYYTGKLMEHGPTSKGVDWNNPESHDLRHRQFLRLLEGYFDASIVDLGCGFGDFLRFLRKEGYRGTFTGYDIAPSMIKEASRIHAADGKAKWRIGADPEESTDFAVASGIFNVKGGVPAEIWKFYMEQNIMALARLGKCGFGFNALTLSGDPERRRPDLFYADPAELLNYCISRFGRSVALLQDYGLYEFTVIVRHTQMP